MRRSGAAAILLPVLIVALAAVLRVWRLDVMPLGLHNDEAWTGINARDVLREGWIGPYLYPSGLGQPAGPVYFTALLFTILPQTPFTLRLSMALFGIAAVAFTYLAAREMFDRSTAAFAAAILAIMPWHLHLSRTAFMVGAWPCVEMAALWLLFRARRQPTAWRFAGVGLLVGAGIYSYNAYLLFVPVIAVPFLHDVLGGGDAGARRRALWWTVAAALTAAWVAIPMVQYAVTHEEYFWHARDVSLFNSERWQEAGRADRVALLLARAGEWTRGLSAGGRPDDGDGLGEPGYPLLDPLTLAAAAVGLGIAGRHWRRPQYAVLIAAAAIIPLGALLTIDDGLYRRTFGLAPFLAMLAALPMAALWRRTPLRHAAAAFAVRAALLAALAATAARNAYAYFGPLQDTDGIRYVYPYQLDAAARVMATLPRDAVVYLYSDRWGARFETIKWYAPDIAIVDRGREYRKDVPADAPLDLSADPERPTAFVLLGRYVDLVNDLFDRYPDAHLDEQQRGDEVMFRVVRVNSGEKD